MKKVKQYLMLLIIVHFFCCENGAQKETEIKAYRGYALLQTYYVNDGRFNFNIFPIDINDIKTFDKGKFVVKYGLIVGSYSYDDYEVFKDELKDLNYNFHDDYILVKIHYDIKNKNWEKSLKVWNDSIMLKGTYHKFKIYFPQNDEIIKINSINIIKKIN